MDATVFCGVGTAARSCRLGILLRRLYSRHALCGRDQAGRPAFWISRSTANGIGLTCEADKTRKVTVEYDVIATDLAWGEPGTNGRQVIGWPPDFIHSDHPPAGERVCDPCLAPRREGIVRPSHQHGRSGVLLSRATQCAGDRFSAAVAKVPSAATIERITVPNPTAPVLSEVTVKLGGQQYG